MTVPDETKGSEGAARKGRGKALLLPAAVALLLGGGAFYAVTAGWVVFPALSGAAHDITRSTEASAMIADGASGGADAIPAYVAFDPFVVSLGPESKSRHLKLELQAETAPGREADVADYTPRIRDILNTFLRAVDARDLANPRSMARLRAQMLRRVQLVTPEGSVRDLLIQEFVLN